MPKSGGVDIAQEPVSQRNLHVDQVRDPAAVQFGLVNLLEDVEVVGSISADLAARDGYGASKEVALKVVVAHLEGLLKLAPRLDLLGEHTSSVSAVLESNRFALGYFDGAEIDLDDVGEIDERLVTRLPGEIV